MHSFHDGYAVGWFDWSVFLILKQEAAKLLVEEAQQSVTTRSR
ncbi:MAG: hypothetical protein AAF961_17425 [Planctomycetota bacterium]